MKEYQKNSVVAIIRPLKKSIDEAAMATHVACPWIEKPTQSTGFTCETLLVTTIIA